MAEKGMILECENGILILSMDMPVNNIMSADFLSEYERVMADIEQKAASGSYKGLIIRGAGRHFCVGADVDALLERSANENYDDSTGVLPESHIQQKHFFTFLSELPFPTVSAVTGFCIGSGSEIAVNSTYRVIDFVRPIRELLSHLDSMVSSGFVIAANGCDLGLELLADLRLHIFADRLCYSHIVPPYVKFYCFRLGDAGFEPAIPYRIAHLSVRL